MVSGVQRLLPRVGVVRARCFQDVADLLHVAPRPERVCDQEEEQPLPAWLSLLARQSAVGQPLVGGRNNQGVWLHQLHPESPDCPIWLIEKRSPRRREARLHRDLRRWQLAHPEANLLPRVYGVLPYGNSWRLFQAYVPEPVVAPMDAVEAGQLLASLAFAFHRTMAAVHGSSDRPAVELLARQQQRLSTWLREDEPLAPSRIERLVMRLQSRLADEPLVLAHNDLHWDNIRMIQLSGVSQHQVIDLGRVGWNLPGAEFHGALRLSLLGGRRQPIWRHAVDHYAALSGGDPEALMLACLWFGLVHGAGIWSQAAASSLSRQRRRESRVLGRILNRLEAQLER